MLFQSTLIVSVPDLLSHIMKAEDSQALYWVNLMFVHTKKYELYICTLYFY